MICRSHFILLLTVTVSSLYCGYRRDDGSRSGVSSHSRQRLGAVEEASNVAAGRQHPSVEQDVEGKLTDI